MSIPPPGLFRLLKTRPYLAEFTLVRESGSISVTSIPAGAKIFLNGTDTTHLTPYTLTNVPVGEHTVVVTLTGHFTPVPANVVVSAGQTGAADFSLTPVGNGDIKVTSAPAGATIFLDGVNTGILTPDTLEDISGREPRGVCDTERLPYATCPDG